jgi:hypothetical protein
MSDDAKPDAGTDPKTMTFEAVLSELRLYDPATASAVLQTEEHRERRQRLWRRLEAGRDLVKRSGVSRAR